MFNRDFYPTPENVIDTMFFGISFNNKNVLEPQGGKANIIKRLKLEGARVTSCEINTDLAAICAAESDVFLKPDFLRVTKEEVAHMDYIFMNPPFSNEEKHILHAWEIAPDNCKIISLCNASICEFRNTRIKRKVNSIIEKNGTFENLGNVFKNAERTTNAEIGLIKLNKPFEDEKIFDSYFDLDECFEDSQPGLMNTDDILNVVSRYVGAVKMFSEVEEKNKIMEDLITPIGSGNFHFGCVKRSSSYSSDITKEDFKIELQKTAWKTIINKLNMNRFVTYNVIQEINKFIEQQIKVPFTRNNIYKMIDMIIQTHPARMSKVIVEAFDNVTMRCKENRYCNEGWKTNSEYVVNKKFIIPSMVKEGYNNDMQSSSYSDNGHMDDLNKALCWLTGTDFAKNESFYSFMCNNVKINEYHAKSRYREFNTWYDWGFFKLKGFKKGTIHVIFKDDKVHELFNREAAKAKGFNLASKFTSDFRQKTSGVEVY